MLGQTTELFLCSQRIFILGDSACSLFFTERRKRMIQFCLVTKQRATLITKLKVKVECALPSRYSLHISYVFLRQCKHLKPQSQPPSRVDMVWLRRKNGENLYGDCSYRTENIKVVEHLINPLSENVHAQWACCGRQVVPNTRLRVSQGTADEPQDCWMDL